MASWQAHAHIRQPKSGIGGAGKTRYAHDIVEQDDEVTVEASSRMQAHVRALAYFRRTYPGATVRVTSVHPLDETEESEQ